MRVAARNVGSKSAHHERNDGAVMQTHAAVLKPANWASGATATGFKWRGVQRRPALPGTLLPASTHVPARMGRSRLGPPHVHIDVGKKVAQLHLAGPHLLLGLQGMTKSTLMVWHTQAGKPRRGTGKAPADAALDHEQA